MQYGEWTSAVVHVPDGGSSTGQAPGNMPASLKAYCGHHSRKLIHKSRYDVLLIKI